MHHSIILGICGIEFWGMERDGCGMKIILNKLGIGTCHGGRWLRWLQKKIAFWILLGGNIFIFSGHACGQEMNSSGSLCGKNIDSHLSPNDVTCKKNRPIEVGKLFCIRMSIIGPNALVLNDLTVEKFDAAMPQHRHGMVTRSTVKVVKTGEYLIEGLKFHMAGEWKISIDLKYREERLQVAIPMKL